MYMNYWSVNKRLFEPFDIQFGVVAVAMISNKITLAFDTEKKLYHCIDTKK